VDDLKVSNGKLRDFKGIGKNYQFKIDPSNEGIVSVHVKAGGAQDAAGNSNLASNQLSWTYVSPQPAPTPTPAPVIVPSPNDTSVACARSGTLSFDASVVKHQDAEAGLRNRYGFGLSVPTSDVASSGVIQLSLADIEGNVLPVSAFALDDIAIIVKESDSIANVLQASADAKTRTIRIPAHAMMIYDGNNANFADGAVDSGSTTTYEFESSSVVLAGGNSLSLKHVYEMGVPLIVHNMVSISELRNRGFVNDSNQVVFKVFLVAHGWGWVTLRFTVSPCK
jgi:hypothetical protein